MTRGSGKYDMKKFTLAVNLYSASNIEIPTKVFEAVGDDFATLVYNNETNVNIDTIVDEDGETAIYPLLGRDMIVPRIHEHIGEGTMGHVYSMMSNTGPVAIKFQEHSSGSSRTFVPGNGYMDVPVNDFTLEVKLQLHMSSVGMSPVIYNAWTSSYSTIWGDGKQDVLVMDRLEETLFVKTSKDKDYIDGVMELISNMHENNIFHGDMHSGNIMIDKENRPWMIDFGRSKCMPCDREGKRWCMVHDYVLLYTSLPRRSFLKPMVRSKILELAPDRTVIGSTFDLGE